MTPVRLEPTAPRSRVKHSTTEPLRSLLLSYDVASGNDITACIEIDKPLVVYILVTIYNDNSVYIMQSQSSSWRMINTRLASIKA